MIQEEILLSLQTLCNKKRGIRRDSSFLLQREVLSFFGLHVDELATLFAGGEHHNSVDEGEKSVILTHAYVKTGVVHSATLTFDDVTCLAV